MNLHITTNHSGKMRGMASLSTPCLINPRCEKNSKIKGSICSHCYARRFLSFRRNMNDPLERNFQILNRKVYDVEEFPKLNVAFFRIEAFGDVASVTQARNYIRLIKRNPYVRFGWWTKNPDLLKKAIEIEGKPDNVNIMLSSIYLNKPTNTRYPFIDSVFTVYEKGKCDCINCGSRSCLNCLQCYLPNPPRQINENLH